MMVLKRLFIVALGPLGFGVLATGTALAQGVTDGNIPAPKLYGDSADCTTGPDTVVNKRKAGPYKQKSLLDTLLDADGELTNTMLTAIITVGSDCANSNPVAAGFELAEDLYNAAANAKKLASVDDPDPDHVAAYAEAKAARDAYGGDVYEAVYTQLTRQGTAKRAVMEYNGIVETGGSLAHAKGLFDVIDITATGNTNLDGYIARDETDPNNIVEEVIGDFGGKDAIEGYRAITGFTADGGTDSPLSESEAFTTAFNSAFTVTGALRLEVDGDGDPVVAGNINTLGEISMQLRLWNAAVKKAEGNLEDAVELGVQNLDPLRETVRKATAGRDHVESELKRLTNVVRAKDYQTDPVDHDNDTNTAVQAVAVSTLISGYNDQLTAKNNAERDVRSTVEALENARDAVQDAIGNPGTFLQQVVDLRTYQRDQRQATVDEFEGDAPDSVTKALENANKALQTAETALNAHNTLVGDENNPASALIEALLETDPKKEDDGQALVNAISSNYEKIAEVAQNIQDVEDLAGPVAANTAKNAEQDMKLMQKKEYIDNLAAEIGVDPVTGEGTGENGMSRIDTNAENIATNASNIMTNAGNIAMNTEAIRVGAGLIADNAAAIGMNSGAIADLGNRVGSNESAIMRNSGMISDLNDSLEVVRAGVAASMALAGMPAINGRGVSIGVGSYDGESAFAVGFQIQGEMASFKVGVTSAGGETGASAGVGFQF